MKIMVVVEDSVNCECTRTRWTTELFDFSTISTEVVFWQRLLRASTGVSEVDSIPSGAVFQPMLVCDVDSFIASVNVFVFYLLVFWT